MFYCEGKGKKYFFTHIMVQLEYYQDCARQANRLDCLNINTKQSRHPSWHSANKSHRSIQCQRKSSWMIVTEARPHLPHPATWLSFGSWEILLFKQLFNSGQFLTLTQCECDQRWSVVFSIPLRFGVSRRCATITVHRYSDINDRSKEFMVCKARNLMNWRKTTFFIQCLGPETHITIGIFAVP